ncbi:GumC family protein [Terriglobus albidus]|uniref:GumC family protein n=1 Tax=Terriglobus albidus TaxID=1592106 RepID=UPI0021DF5861|nr:Wzz/FepE/Etk N-terminal domain-containing protein [Terriglobus albidus]
MTLGTGNFERSELLAGAAPITTSPRNVDLLDALLVLARSWRAILLTALVFFLASCLVAFLLKTTFTGQAVILPPAQQQSSASALTGQLGALAGITGGAAAANLFKNPGELYVGILESNAIADRLIDRFNLRSIYHTKTLVDTRGSLKNHVVFKAEKNGLISITVTDHDAHRASDLANGYVAELHKLNSTLAITEAAQRRMFFEQEVANEKAVLETAENDLKATAQKTGLIQVSSQAEVIIRSIAQLRAEITYREVELQSMRTFAADQNPDVQRLSREIASMKDHLATLENSQEAQSPGDIWVPTGRVAQATLEYSRKLREVKYHDALYSLLLKQYEVARIDEGKSSPLVQVVDPATPPDKNSGPPRGLIVAGGGLAGFILGIAWVMLRPGFQRMGDTPETAERLRELRNSFRMRS